MSDQKADTKRIRNFAGTLKKAHYTFSRQANPAAGRNRSDLGSQELIDAFSEFGSNWDARREELVSELKSLHDLTETFVDSYDKVDHDLAEALRDSDEKAKRK